MPLLSYAVVILGLWFLAVHLIRLVITDPKAVLGLDALLTVAALIWLAVEAHKGGMF